MTKKMLAERVVDTLYDDDLGCHILKGLVGDQVYDEYYDDRQILIDNVMCYSVAKLKELDKLLDRLRP